MARNLWARRNALVLTATLVVLAGTFFGGSRYWEYSLSMVAIYAIVGIGFNLALGVAGQVTFAQVAFMAVGGYADAILTVKVHWNPWLAVLGGICCAAVIASVVYIPFLRLRGHYLAMGTLALALGVYSLAGNADSLTGGALGIPGIPLFSIGGTQLESQQSFFVLLWAAVGLCLLLHYLLVGSHFGRAWRSIAARPDVAASVGINVPRLRMLALVVASAEAGLAGALFAQFLNYVAPDYFSTVMIGDIFFVLVVGGSGELAGPLLGAAFVVLVPQQITFLGSWQDIVMLVVLLAVLIVWPTGLLGRPQRTGGLRRLLPGRLATAPAPVRRDPSPSATGGTS
jgi:branched-chain amino acid transport system permease protein